MRHLVGGNIKRKQMSAEVRAVLEYEETDNYNDGDATCIYMRNVMPRV